MAQAKARIRIRQPLPSNLGTHKLVKARFWAKSGGLFVIQGVLLAIAMSNFMLPPMAKVDGA